MHIALLSVPHRGRKRCYTPPMQDDELIAKAEFELSGHALPQEGKWYILKPHRVLLARKPGIFFRVRVTHATYLVTSYRTEYEGGLYSESFYMDTLDFVEQYRFSNIENSLR